MANSFKFEPYSPKSPYGQWQEREGIPAVKGWFVEDLAKVPLQHWPRKGGKGAFINLEGTENTSDAYLCEINPGGNLKPQKHMFEELIFVLSGRGATTIRGEGMPERTFEWHQGSLFSPPLNMWHQHFNGSGNEPARYVAVTNAPTIVNLFHNLDFVFNNTFVFDDRYYGEEDYFTGEGNLYERSRVWDSNFVPDVMACKLLEHDDMGPGRGLRFEMANNTLCAHRSEFPVGAYWKAHRHGPGAHIVVLKGKGYSLLWPEGHPRTRIDWQVGSMFVPPGGWFHHHFNTSNEPAMALAMRWMGLKYKMGKEWKVAQSAKLGGDQIAFEDEDAEIRQIYERELMKEGLPMRMPLKG